MIQQTFQNQSDTVMKNKQLLVIRHYPSCCVCARVLTHFSYVSLFVTLWAIARHAPLLTGSPGNTGVGCQARL